MKISLERFQEMGAFAPVGLIEETVTWRQGGEDVSATVFVKPLSYNTAVCEMVANGENTDALAARIAASICDEAGEPVFSVGDITGEADPERGPLNHSLTMALLAIIGRVNCLGKSKSRSVTKKKSGTSS